MTTRAIAMGRALTGATSLALGALYALGVFVKYAQLRKVHVSVTDTLPLIPIQQFLTTGIAFLLTTLLAMGAVAAAWFLVGLARRDDPKDTSAIKSPLGDALYSTLRIPGNDLTIVLVLASAFCLFLLYIAPIVDALTLGSVLFVVAFAWRRGRWTGRLFAAYFVALLCVHLAEAFFNPKPLPDAVVATAAAHEPEHARLTTEPVAGKLLVVTDAVWYVGGGAASEEGRIVAIPTSEILSDSLQQVRRRWHEPVLKRLWRALR